MHELGVVFYVIRDVKEVAGQNGVKRISAVTLQIGEVSGIIPSYLTDCWNWARKKEPVVGQAELRIETIGAVTFCEACGREYPTVQYAKTCPYCGSEQTYLLRGNEFLIKEIEVPPDELPDEPGTDAPMRDEPLSGRTPPEPVPGQPMMGEAVAKER